MQRVKGVGITAAVAAVLVVTTPAVGGTNLISVGVLNPAPDGTVASGVYAISPEGTYAVGYSNGPDSAGTATIQQPIIWSQATGLVQLPNPVDIDGQARGVVVRPNAGMIGIAGNINNRMYYYQAPPDNLASGSWIENGRFDRGLIGPYNTARLGVDYPATEGWFIGGDWRDSLKDYVQGVDGPASLDHKNTGGGDCVSHSVSGEKWTAGYDHGNPGGQHRALFMNYNNGDVQVVIPGGSSYLSEALGISAAGTVLSGYDATDANNNQAFVWKVGDAAMTLLDTLPGDTQSNAITVNLIGSDYITAGYSSDGANERAVIWDTTGTWDNTGQPKLVSDLLAALGGDLSVWTGLTRVTTMSDDGMTIAGYGIWSADGSTRGFIARCCPRPFADFDLDNDVDQDDFAEFQVCFTGPGPTTVVGKCKCFDRDNSGQGDQDVDIDDFVIFQACASGPSVPLNPACEN